MSSNPEAFKDATVANKAFIEEQYERFLQSPDAVDPSWKEFFTSFDFSSKAQPSSLISSTEQTAIDRASAIDGLIEAYRTFGHLKSKVDPLNLPINEHPWQLDLKRFDLDRGDAQTFYPTKGLLPKAEASLSEIIAALESIYCGSVGIEYMNLQKQDVEEWLQHQIEPQGFKGKVNLEQKKLILEYLNKSELFEIFLHTKYTGQKRFSLEGGETLIPMLAAILDKGAELGVQDFFLGMSHRGRLNVLANILKKSYSRIFSEFDEKYHSDSFEESGDVKYHKGFLSENLSSHGHKIHVVLTPNPSHLEAVNPVIEGEVYAKQQLHGLPEGKSKVVPILIHGDAAISGQGVVYETLQFQKLDGYNTGGTLHIVINNQIGFTTIPKDSRSTRYCTDIALAFGSPIFHVNAEDPEGCVYAAYLAMEMRQKFQCDVFLDLVCYRKYGHNEGDEPAFTQPNAYASIARKKSIRELYREALIQEGVLEKKLSEELEVSFKESLQNELKLTKENQSSTTANTAPQSTTMNTPFRQIETGVPMATLQQMTAEVCRVPEGFNLHPKLARLLSDRTFMVSGGNALRPVDWGMAELLAIGSLLWEGVDVRLSGQDSCRGTFSHRHAVWIDQKNEQAYCSLKNLKPDQGQFEIYNSSLSEYAAMGFELGYSLVKTKALVLWEAQFGDFSNTAQVIIDQFIASGEQKWGQQSALTLLLPHGYEGQGPEHSSARMERFLTLSGQNNLRLVNPSTPAQLFHLLRRQALLNEKKPLVVFTPKALLRHPACVSKIDELVTGSFQEILDDPNEIKTPKQLIVCSGHIYYDLIAEREKLQAKDVAIIRIEQLYPFHKEKMKELLEKYKGFEALDWVQEEPGNMGAACYMDAILKELLPETAAYRSISRPISASPAVGSYSLHKKQFADLMSRVFHQ